MASNEPVISTIDVIDSSPTTPKTTSNIRTLSVFQPNVFSTPINLIEKENEQAVILSIQNDSFNNNLPIGVASFEFIQRFESIIKERSFVNRRNRTVLSTKNGDAENNERINRANFFFKDVATSLSYVDVFNAIGAMFPLVQLNVSNNSPKVQYLCVAGNVFIDEHNLISLHLF